jgi:hypothetical protein
MSVDQETLHTSSESKPGKTGPNAAWYVKLLLAVHIVCITIWAIPKAKDDEYNGHTKPPIFDVGDWMRLYNSRYLKTFPPVAVWLFVTGTWQYWDMFAPNPLGTDSWVDAEIIYKDGSHKFYLYPRMYALSLLEKMPQERFRKYLERAGDPGMPWLWPQFALRIAYLNDSVKNPPTTVKLFKHTLVISDPGTPQPTNYASKMYFEYAVNQRELARLRALP